MIRPSNDRDWSPDQAILSTAQFSGDKVHVRNIRNCAYRTAQDYDVRHYDKTFDLGKLDEVDFIVVPFVDSPSLAHTFVSFGFQDQGHLAVSVEIRKEKGETYDPVKAAMGKYELMYVVGDERDLIGLRTNQRLDDVYLYKARVSPELARAFFVDVMERVNWLAENPELYDTLTNNCTTNIARHVNNVSPGAVPYNYEILFPGYSDRLAYDLKLIDTELPFDQARALARVNPRAQAFRDEPDFSKAIRR